jgi:hypothetical protein
MQRKSERRETANRRGASVTTVRLSSIVVAWLLVGFLVLHESYAAFTASTANAANSFEAGSVDLVDDDASSAMFNAAGLVPGDELVHCITVTYTGDIVPTAVRMYGSTAGTGLASYLDLEIEVGTGGDFSTCAGFSSSGTLYADSLANFASDHGGWANGVAAFTAASSSTARTFRFTLTLQDDNAAQGRSASATFTWEARTS